ncbi:hypothetical protein J4772_11455 [Cohnella sp. LGH]|uniref:hypothetical protein n=1 Tax=Cohnella sp. LGH TaxID=1619153 RepID=UPI001ADC68DC|nr:hypothetical protein [Cohnella sp. LGH]QTH44957.1 hypothetical protein J4772_11455 [Cohnella sp. LGH]
MRKKDETATTEQGLPLDDQTMGDGIQGSDPSGEPPAEQEGANQPPSPPEPPETEWGICLTNIKHDRTHFRAGDKVEIPVTTFRELLAAKAVRRLAE